MKHLLSLLLFVGTVAIAEETTVRLCSGIVPPNNKRIPVSRISSEGGITQAEFNGILEKIQSYYTPVVAARGGQLVVNNLWEDETVNASADRAGTTYIINMYGGLARYPAISRDGMLLVACHEMGHHLGGAPKLVDFDSGWASNEGEADYYGTLRCMRFMFQGEDNAGWITTHNVDPVATATCMAAFMTVDEQNVCIRSATAGQNLAVVFQGLREDKTTPRFDTPDQDRVDQTDDNHPATQCRMDTYYEGALCVHDVSTELSETDFRIGTCIDETKVGFRPRCWFSPESSAPRLSLARAN